MSKRGCACFVLAAVVVGLTGLVAVAQRAEVTTWAVPTADCLPEGIGITPSGKVFFAEYSTDKIGLLDPTTNEIRERDVGDGPSGLVVSGEDSVYFTTRLDNALELLVFIGGGNRWLFPTSSGSPRALVPASSGPGSVNLWSNERSAAKVARFSPETISVTLPLIIAEPVVVAPDVIQIDPVVTLVAPQAFPGNPMLPPPIYYNPGVTTGPFTEWSAIYESEVVEDLAVAPDGQVWFTQTLSPLTALDPTTDTMLVYGLPPGTNAVGVRVDDGGDVWFTDASRPAIGRLDPMTGDVHLWTIPGGNQPLDLGFDSAGNVWFTDRAGDAVGYLSPARNEMALYSFPLNTHPLQLAIDGVGNVWFTAERGNFVARLEILPVLGPPPIAPSAATFTGYSISQEGSRADISVTYAYDGSMGLPVWIGVRVMSGGFPIPDFSYAPVRIDHSGGGTVHLDIEYRGTGAVDSDGIRLFMSAASGETVLASREVEFVTTWRP